MKLNIVTRCTRPDYMSDVEKSIQSCKEIDLKWTIIIDTSVLHEIPSDFLEKYSKYDLRFMKGIAGDMGHKFINKIFDEIQDDEWVYVLDDDNQMHPELIETIKTEMTKYPAAQGFIFSQSVGKKDFSGLDIREAKPENVKVQSIDMGQFFLKKSLIGEKRLESMKYVADGVFIEELYKEKTKDFIFIDKVLCYYNSLRKENSGNFLPRIMLLGSEKDLKSVKRAQYESDDLKVFYTKDHEVIDTIINHDPDCILTIGEDYNEFPSLTNLSPDMRLRWVHSKEDDHAGEIGYVCAMNYILKSSVENDLVSIFTPIYNTGKKIIRTYNSLTSQTYTNWEWVIVNDSDNLETMKIVESLNDPRIKIYDFRKKSGGVIGEVKYRAASMCRGKYLVELDHDDFLLPHAIQKVVEAFNAYPDAGFVYTDCAEIDENYNSLMYGEGFAFGYGKYRTETHIGKEFQIAVTPNINPVTIRHIVGVPNHLRAWKRDTYHKIGGHNRRLTIADDYELIVRTFLETRMVRIPVGCYLQFHHGENSQNAARTDIQRRVRTIAEFYDDKIRNRFKELGKVDWAFGENIRSFETRSGEHEQYVNYIYG